MKRIEHNANTKEEVLNYYQTRARQLISEGFIWSKKLTPIEGGYSTIFYNGKEEFLSFYILEDNRKKRLGIEAIKCSEPIITVPDCKIEDFLEKYKKEFFVKCHFTETLEYKSIQEYYGNKRAARSNCYLMNHIDEGLYILNSIGASVSAKKAFCIHPIIQSDDDLAANWCIVKNKFNANVLGLALEYRHIANAYLSDRYINSIEDINLSPLQEVNDMLIADKIQNYKDFIIYHSKSHDRKDILDTYFKNWLIKLNISMYRFEELSDKLKDIEI